MPVHHEHLAGDEDGTNSHVPSWQICSFESFMELYDLANNVKRLELHRNDGSNKSTQSDHVPMAFIGKPLIYELSMKNQLSATGQVRFNVLWLSPTVFISPLQFDMNSTLASDYIVELCVRACPKLGGRCKLNVYSVSSFNVGVQHGGPSLLPFGFLRSMTKRLPDNYFSRICLFQKEIPPALRLEFLSIFPSYPTEPQSCQRRRGRTVCVFVDPPNTEQSSAILSSHLLTVNSLYLDLDGCIASNSAHLRPTWNVALRESRTLRHVCLSSSFIQAVWSEHDIPFTTNSNIESLIILLVTDRPALTFFLDGVARNDGIKSLYIYCYPLNQETQHEVAYLIRSVLPDHPSLKEVSISLNGFDHLVHDRALDHFVSYFAEWKMLAKRVNLVHFSIVHSHSRWPVQRGALFRDWWDKDMIPWWDKNMIPFVVLNWYKNEMKQSKSSWGVPQQARPSDSKQLPCNLSLQVLGVIRGNVYREVTSQVAVSDPTTTNCTILFEMLHGYLYLPKTTL
jgi:hypothetical protein